MAVQDHHKKTLIKIIRKHLPETEIWLFGSRAQNQERPGSDIDIALDNKQPIAWHIITKILLEIEETTIPAAVDVIDLQTCEQPFIEEVQKKGILWTE